jgi:hypothetical protein
MLSADDAAPSDRPNLSKDYLAGTAEESPQVDEFYREIYRSGAGASTST